MNRVFVLIVSALLLAVTVNCKGNNACTNGKVHTTCGSACPLTCDNKDNPPLCLQSCQEGCFCPSGMVTNSDDQCVQPDDCEVSVNPSTTSATSVTEPTPSNTVCTNGKVHDTCGSACPLTCDNKDNPPACILSCEQGCFCPSNMVLTADDQCVLPENCPAIGQPSYCQLSPAPGLCKGSFPRYFYNSTSGKCELFTYGGCGGNDNNFEAMEDCSSTCQASVSPSTTTATVTEPTPTNTVDYCTLPPQSGLCEAYMPSYFYNSTSKKCESFIYGGCGGNQNRFTTVESCMEACGGGDQVASTTLPSPTNTACSNGKVYTECGTACPITCANKDSPPLICPLVCVIGCVCPQGMAEHEGGCYELEECPSTTTATPSPSNPPPVLETVVEAVYSEQSLCPSIADDILGTCEQHCTSNEDCEDWEACCSNGCGHSCMETVQVPYYAPPMQCPQPIVPICNFHFACGSHDDCEGDSNYCCSSGCGEMCMAGVQATPTCKAVKKSVESSGLLLGAYVPQCEENGNFSAVQCHASTGMCWCVETDTGKPLTAPVMAQQPNCDEIGNDKCKGIQCDWPVCGDDVQPITDEEHCCPYCPADCQVGEQSYPSGSSYTAPDGCNTCSCYNGNAACTLMACVQSCTYNGNQYYQGQSFNSTDGCNTCFCDGGSVFCTEKACLPVCKAFGMEMNEGETRSDGCSECVCKNRHISCTLSEQGCEKPVTRSVDISMRFNGDYDVVSQDIEGFKVSFKTSLVAKYQHLNLHESQITDMEVSRGSVIVEATLQDNVLDDDETGPDTANITLVLIQLEQDYNSNNLVIQYQDVTLDPTGDFSYADQDDDDEEEVFFWAYVGIAIAFMACVVLLLVVIIVMVKTRALRARRVLVSTKDDFQRYEMSGDGKKGFPNPTFGNTEKM